MDPVQSDSVNRLLLRERLVVMGAFTSSPPGISPDSTDDASARCTVLPCPKAQQPGEEGRVEVEVVMLPLYFNKCVLYFPL